MELALVLGVLSLGAVILVPKFVLVINNWDLDIEANKLSAKIRQVQQTAIAKQTNCKITWNIATNQYSIYTYSGGSYVLDETSGLTNNVTIMTTSFIVNPGTVIFDQFGAPSESGMVVLHHTVPGFENKYVIIQAATGQVKIL